MNIILMLPLLLQQTGVAEFQAALPGGQPIADIQTLIRKTENRDIELKAELRTLQQQLTDAYANFELDEAHIRRIHRKIVDSQEKLLMNYHTLQFGYRRILGPKDFAKTKSRIDHYVKTAEQRRRKQKDRAEKKKQESD